MKIWKRKPSEKSTKPSAKMKSGSAIKWRNEAKIRKENNEKMAAKSAKIWKSMKNEKPKWQAKKSNNHEKEKLTKSIENENRSWKAMKKVVMAKAKIWKRKSSGHPKSTSKSMAEKRRKPEARINEKCENITEAIENRTAKIQAKNEAASESWKRQQSLAHQQWQLAWLAKKRRTYESGGSWRRISEEEEEISRRGKEKHRVNMQKKTEAKAWRWNSAGGEMTAAVNGVKAENASES